MDYGGGRRSTGEPAHARPGLGTRWLEAPLLGTTAARRWAWGLLAVCVVVVVVLGVLFAHQTTADGFDRVLDDPVINSLGRNRTLVGWMSWPGTQIPALVISLAMVVACVRSRRLNGVVLALAAVLVATRLDDVLLKGLFGRTYLGALTYPSGHTSSIVALCVAYAVLFVLPSAGSGGAASARERRWRRAGLAILLLLVVSTVVGVIGLRWHYFTDTVAGAAVAVATVCALCLLLDGVAGFAGGAGFRRSPGGHRDP